MRLSSLASVLFASVVATGCATGADTAIDEGVIFDADGKADSATGAPGQNPGKFLLDRLNQCDERWQSGSYISDEGSTEDGQYFTCMRAATNAAGWTTEWRAAQVDATFDPGTLVRGSMAKLRTEYEQFCGGLRQGHSSAYDSDMQDFYFDMFCKRAGEHAIADVMMDFTFKFMNDDVEQFRVQHLDAAPFAYECFSDLQTRLNELQDAADERDAYGNYRDCVAINLGEFAASAEDFTNHGIDEWNAGNAEYGDIEPSPHVTTLADVNAILETNAALCKTLVTAGAYKSNTYFDEAEAVIPQARCEVRMGLYAVSQIEALYNDAGSFDIETGSPEGE